MRKFKYLMCIFALPLFLISCGEPGTDPPNVVTECVFSGTQTFTMTDFGLKLPYVQSANVAYHNAFNVGGVIYNLNTLLEINGDYRYENDAKIYGKFTADGTYCKGEEPFEYKKNNSNVMNNSITVPVPSNSLFYGEITIMAKTDSFREQGSGGNQGFYVRWEVIENDPDFFVEGNLQGEKVNFDMDEDMMYIPGVQEPIFIDGNYELPRT